MRCYKALICSIVLISLFCLSFPHRAYAYLDPGTGSLMLQFLIAAVIGGLYSTKRFWDKAKNFLKRIFSRNRRA